MRKDLISGSLLARNMLLNLIGQAVPLLVGVVTIPIVVRGLGIERFGLLSLAWVILGYLTIFDFGLERATTKYVAEALGRGDENQVPHLVWTSVTMQAVFGAVGALVLVAITPLLAERILTIPLDLVREAKVTFYYLAIALPLLLVSSSFSGVLQAAQRFDLLNAVRLPSNVLMFLVPLVGLFFGLSVPGIVVLMLLSRLAALVALVVLDLRVLANLRKFSVHLDLFPRLFAYGSWIAVSSMVGPVLVYLDRFLTASLLSIAAVAYYTAPYEVVTRLWIIPASLTMSLFPAFSTLEAVGDQARLGALFACSIKYILLVLGPIVLMLVLFASEVLQAWLGGDFAMQSAMALQILALGVLINSLAQIPYGLLQGVGRPDFTAKFHLVELPFYLGIAWFLISRWGITGAATAWTVRVALDALLLFAASFKVCRLSLRLFAVHGLLSTIFVLSLLAGVFYGLKGIAGALPTIAQGLIFMSLFGCFIWVVWRNVLEASDRRVVLKAVQLWQGPGQSL
jgi:O-antigen/teichoic acid export membrane protein